MRLTTIIIIILTLGAAFLYNTIWFQAFFFHKKFYENIHSEPFDVTKKNESTSIKINYKYNTCYDLSISVPGSKLFHSEGIGKGALKYQFISDGRILKEGITFQPSKRNLSLYNGRSSVSILAFDLPFPGANGDLTLNLKVIDPMIYLKKYSNNITCQINPDYNPDFNQCYNKDLKITQ